MDPELLDKIADSVNPLIILAALAFGFARGPASRQVLPSWRFLAGLVLGLAVVYALQNLDSRLHLWPQFGLDYSTHSAVAVSVTTSLAFGDRRWLFALVPLLLGYGWMMGHLGYHSAADMLTAAAAAGPTTWLCHRLVRGKHSASGTDLPLETPEPGKT